MSKWATRITIGVLSAGLMAPVVVPKVIIPLYDRITGGKYKVVEQWMPYIQENTSRYGIDPMFVAAVIYYESSGIPTQISPQNCIGLMQVCVDTARSECNIYNPQQLLDPATNIACGTKYIYKLLSEHARGDYAVAAAMYIGGPKFNPRAQDAHGNTPLTYSSTIMQHYQSITQKYAEKNSEG